MSLTKKLKLKQEPLYLLKAPDKLLPLFSDFDIKKSLSGKGTIGQVLLFAIEKKVIEEVAPKVIDRLGVDALFWIAYPKKSGSIKSDMSRDSSWDVIDSLGYAPVTQVSVDEDWSAVRFRTNEAIGPKLRDTVMAERKVEGVDFVNRKVTMPKDVKKAFNEHKDLLDLFNSMSFSHKREYIEHIVTAKKPETRERRIHKMIDQLQQMKNKQDK